MRIARKRVLVLDSSEVVGQWTERLRISSRPDDDSIVEKKKENAWKRRFTILFTGYAGFPRAFLSRVRVTQLLRYAAINDKRWIIF